MDKEGASPLLEDEKKIVEIKYKGKMEKFVLKPLDWGSNNECLRKATRLNPITQAADLDPYTYNEYRLLMSLIDAPIQINLPNIRKLPRLVGDKLISEVDKLSNMDNETLKKSESPSDPKE